MLKLDRPLVVIDTETTGVETDLDRIVQIAVLHIVNPADPPREIKYLVDPGVPIPPEATAIHGIRDEDVRGSLSFSQVWLRHVGPVVLGADVCAYNARFDLAMIDRELSLARLHWERSGTRIIDPMVIFRRFLPHTLEGAVQYYSGESMAGAHDALIDCKNALVVLLHQTEAYEAATAEDLARLSRPEPDDRFCDSGRKFTWRFGRPVHSTGKHRGKPIEFDLRYLDWMLRGITDLPDDTRDIIKQAIRGNVPTKGVTDGATKAAGRDGDRAERRAGHPSVAGGPRM